MTNQAPWHIPVGGKVDCNPDCNGDGRRWISAARTIGAGGVCLGRF